MKNRQYSLRHLLLSALAGAVITLGAVGLALWLVLGPHALSLVNAWVLVESRFVGEYDPDAAADSALAGLVDGLGDRWSYYLTAQEYEDQNQRRNNAYVGVGITVDYTDERGLLILEVLADSPADKAGVLAGEVVTAVDGTSVAGEARYGGADAISGEAGQSVTLTLLGEDGGERDVELVRAALETEPVSARMLENGVGYVRLENFYSGSGKKLNAAVDDLLEQGAEALVFDMRNNGGGYVHELTEMLDHLLPEGAIFRAESKSGEEEVTWSDAACVEVPMAVLVNGGSYSAAEFFAAQLRETAGAIVVGEETSGKGYSQQSFPLPAGGAMNISTGKYTTGGGVSLVGTGVTLDAEVSLSEEEERELRRGRLEPAADAQLQKVLELLKKQK